MEQVCVHPYVIGKGPVKFCTVCRRYLGPEKQKPNKAQISQLIMPPAVFGITEKLWEQIAPWPRIPFKIVKKYGWYVSVIGMDEYLVMPILRDGKPVFYSARRLTDHGGLKYTYPKGQEKLVWLSSNKVLDCRKSVVLCEGVADAAYVSQIKPSIALLGSDIPIGLALRIKAKEVWVMMDGDAMGVQATMRIIRKFERGRAAFLPTDKDPTDLTLAELRRLMK